MTGAGKPWIRGTLCAGGAMLGIAAVAGCAGVLRGAYTSEAEAQCRDLPTPAERMACEQAVFDAEVERRSQGRQGE